MPRRVLISLIAVIAILGACGDDGDGDPAAGADRGAETTTTDTGDGTTTGDDGNGTDGTDGEEDGEADTTPAAFDFVLEDVRGGDAVNGSSYAGSDVVVWFWAPWCTKCNQEADDIAALAAERDDVRFLGMAGLDGLDAARDFVDRHGLDGFAHAYDEDGDTWQEFGITTQSSFAFVDDDGSVETVSYTVLGGEEMRRRIDELVAS